MTKEEPSTFNPVETANQLIKLAQGMGWQEKHLPLAQELLDNYASNLEGIKIPFGKGRDRERVTLKEALDRTLQRYRDLYSVQSDPTTPRLDNLKEEQRKREAKKGEARRRELHLVSWTGPLEPEMILLSRDDFGPPVKSLVFADDPSSFLTRTYGLHQRELGKVIVLVEGRERAETAISMLKLNPEKLFPERLFFIGIVADEEEIGPTEESLLARLEDSPEKLIGVISKGESLDKLCSNILEVLKEKFPPPDPVSRG